MSAFSAPTSTRNLVVVRAGDKSLHPGWLSGDVPRNWDLIVSYYGSDPDIFRDANSRRIDHRGGKWDGLYQLFAEHGHLLSEYDRIWLPDDDISATAASINRIFDAMAEYKVDLLQPSLTPNSYVSWYHTLTNRLYRFRYTNLVEVMVPCLTARHLSKVLPLLRANMSGIGLDFIWCRLFPDPKWRAGILDEVSVHHTRPIGSALATKMRAMNRSAADDLAEIRRLFPSLSAAPYKEMNPYAAIDLAGNTVTGQLRLALGVLRGLDKSELALSPNGKHAIQRKKWISARRTLRYGANLGPLELRAGQ
ncbi:MAG: hypothetical protein ACK4TP_08860 [Hyphomicrobium sp.]